LLCACLFEGNGILLLLMAGGIFNIGTWRGLQIDRRQMMEIAALYPLPQMKSLMTLIWLILFTSIALPGQVPVPGGLKGNPRIIKLLGYDLLGQTQNLQRYTGNSFIEDLRSTSLKQIFTLHFSCLSNHRPVLIQPHELFRL